MNTAETFPNSTFYQVGDLVNYCGHVCRVTFVSFGGDLIVKSVNGTFKGTSRTCPTRVTRVAA